MRCPALLISTPASGRGKTTATGALARWHRRQGRRVRVFKTGPDFLDPMVLERACGEPVHQLDLWMGGEAHCRELLYRAACEVDLILIEGVMEARLVNLGVQSAELPEGEVRGHTFHHARIETPLAPAACTRAQRSHGRNEGIYRSGRLHASFLHMYFPSNPLAIARLFTP